MTTECNVPSCSTYRLPEGVPGWLSPAEGEQLEKLARGRTVLELGTFVGLSTICLARTAAKVHTVDWHRGDEQCLTARDHSGNRLVPEGTGVWSLPACVEALHRHGVEGRVTLHVGRMEEVLPHLRGHFDLVFVDGCHDEYDARRDIGQALRLLTEGGTVVLHDWDYPAVRQAAARCGLSEPVGTLDSLAWFGNPAPVLKDKRANVFIGIPCYNAIIPQALEGLLNSNTDAVVNRYVLKTQPGSLLCLGFNRLWVAALNSKGKHGWTHFAMHHADIEAMPGWLDALILEQQRTGADILSAIMPIKDGRGLTSTVIMTKAGGQRRLTMREVMCLPPTFGIEHLGSQPGEFLGVNTGLWVCDFSKPWVEKMWFSNLDAIKKNEDGQFTAHVLSEDWEFSAGAHEAGLRVMATRVAEAHHHGGTSFSNHTAWGNWSEDYGDQYQGDAADLKQRNAQAEQSGIYLKYPAATT